MKPSLRFLALCVGLTMAVQTATYAHFKLLEPASWLVESDRGDPQGGTRGGSKYRQRTELRHHQAVGGQKLHLKIQRPSTTRAIAWRWRSTRRPSCRPIRKRRREFEKGPQSVSAAIRARCRSRCSRMVCSCMPSDRPA